MAARIISALFLIPFVLFAVYYGGLPLCLMLLALSLFALDEFFAIAARKGASCFRAPAFVITALYYINAHFFFVNKTSHGFEFSPVMILGAVFLILWLQFYKRIENSILDISATVFAYFYIPVFLSFAMYIRTLEYGAKFLFMAMILVWAADTFAYFGGMAFGRGGKRLSPAISPKKSVVGVYFGLVFSCAAASAFYLWAPAAQMPFWAYILYAFALNAFSVLGDLIESQFKRDGEVKDSSGLIPGHGGVLDRIDSLLLTLPFSYYYFVLFVK
ncbi:MAG TPA: phosphatidate cytidylyltransferase [Candidatus Wallbacteria bacterium]|nr:phosphatidate cytidylyltransferase [Candidatus Wallbacteria bacterium]